jgi:DNA repair exonuclease SbcCD nuclease subunit
MSSDANGAGEYRGVLFIGDPHLEGRQPGFRKDDYPRVILEKIDWCLNYAAAHALLPAFLGDIFDKPRDNPTWMLGGLIDMLSGVEAIGIYGNHDCAEPELTDNDSLMLLFKAGSIRRISAADPWIGRMQGRRVLIGGSSYREPFPEKEILVGRPSADASAAAFGLWLAHHDVIAPGYEEQGRVKPRELPGIDLVVNGHIHRRLGEVFTGRTRWVTPGNISRRSRSDAARDHVPAVLRLDVGEGGYELSYITVPHAPFEEVFHPVAVDTDIDPSDSAFVRGLAELQARRTATGAGFMTFIEQNLEQFTAPVAQEIRSLAEEVTKDDGSDTE